LSFLFLEKGGELLDVEGLPDDIGTQATGGDDVGEILAQIICCGVIDGLGDLTIFRWQDHIRLSACQIVFEIDSP